MEVNMRKIVLLCAAGMSTSLLVNKIKQSASKIGYECEVEAHPVAEASIHGQTANVILLGPQVKFNLNKVKQQVPCPVEAIDMRAYGMMDGDAVIKQVKKILGD